MRDFEKLAVWRRAHELVLDVYQDTAHFPDHERYGLRSQLRRACVSIPANLAEGCGCRTDRNFRRYVDQAGASSKEVQYHLLLSRDLEYLASAQHDDMAARLNAIQRMLRRLYDALT